jgi:hypothetical protein
MSSRLNNSSKPALDYSKLLKKNTQSQESDTKSAVVPTEVQVPVQEPVKTGKKLSEARYAKKLESKAQKKADTEKEDKMKEEKLAEIRVKAQKAFDDEYQIQFIKCKTPEEAHKKSMLIYDKVYNKLVNAAFPKPIIEKVTTTDMKIKEIVLSEDDDDELLVPVKQDIRESSKSNTSSLQQQTITPEELKDFKSVSKKRNSKSESNNSYNEMLNKACDTFIVDILSESILDKLETSLRKSESTDKVFVPVNTDSDVITSFKGHNFTKSGFLKNTNYYFSKQLSKAINNKLKDLRVWVNIKNVKDNEYSIAFSQKH